MKQLVKKLSLVLGMMFVSSCVTQGQDFSSDLTWIKTNQTSRQDVKSLLKAPHSVGNSSGTPTWTYGFYKYRLFGKSTTKELKLYWNSDSTVKSFSFNSSFPKDTGKSTM